MSTQNSRGATLNVRRLVELDLAFLGPRIIVAEFALGVGGSLLLGLLSLAYAMRLHLSPWSWPVLLGIELVAIGINYVPLLIEALRMRGDTAGIATTNAAMCENGREARSHGIRQAWILVPGAVVLFAITNRGRTSGS